MDQDIYEPTVRTSIDDIEGPVENPGYLTEVKPRGETTFVLDRSIVIIGNDEAADIRVEGHAIAPYHAEVVHDDGVYRIRHIEGGAPVRVNGEKVRDAVLADGDAVAIAEHTFAFRRPPAAEPAR